jgi:hypothetical protein
VGPIGQGFYGRPTFNKLLDIVFNYKLLLRDKLLPLIRGIEGVLK